ncbi:MAG: glycosyltransferase family 2 protein [Tenuifilaceae bacterium]
MKNNAYKVSIVIPAFNEEGNIRILSGKLQEILSNHPDYEIIFVDDGSSDNTLNILKDIHTANPQIRFLSFSRNFGHQNAIKAGLDYSSGNCVVIMDGDMQHPPELVAEMIDKWQAGYDIVYTLRKDDPKTGVFKKITASAFYKLMNKISDIDIEEGSADFMLLDRVVVDIVKNLDESPLFFRGLIRWVGFKKYGISYMPNERHWGKTKYSFTRMVKFAVTGITSFSVRPLYFSIQIGFIIAILSFLYAVYALYIRLFTDTTIPGWTSLLIIVSFIGGIQLIMIGILGEYVGKIFMAQKKRPNYIVKEKSNS